MSHLKILIIPILMLTDYFLTVVGARLSEKKYRLHFKISSYELNPIFEKHIAQKRWFSAKHSACVFVVTAFCWFWANNWNDLGDDNEMLFGFFIGLFSTIIGAHLTNIFTFIYLNKNQAEVSGEVTLHHCYALSTTSFRYLTALLPLIFIGIFSGSPFVYGTISSVIILICLHIIWYVKARKSRKKPI